MGDGCMWHHLSPDYQRLRFWIRYVRCIAAFENEERGRQFLVVLQERGIDAVIDREENRIEVLGVLFSLGHYSRSRQFYPLDGSQERAI